MQGRLERGDRRTGPRFREPSEGAGGRILGVGQMRRNEDVPLGERRADALERVLLSTLPGAVETAAS